MNQLNLNRRLTTAKGIVTIIAFLAFNLPQGYGGDPKTEGKILHQGKLVTIITPDNPDWYDKASVHVYKANGKEYLHFVLVSYEGKQIVFQQSKDILKDEVKRIDTYLFRSGKGDSLVAYYHKDKNISTRTYGGLSGGILVVGGVGDDRIYGTNPYDSNGDGKIDASEDGMDRLEGEAGADLLFGRGGMDFLYAGLNYFGNASDGDPDVLHGNGHEGGYGDFLYEVGPEDKAYQEGYDPWEVGIAHRNFSDKTTGMDLGAHVRFQTIRRTENQKGVRATKRLIEAAHSLVDWYETAGNNATIPIPPEELAKTGLSNEYQNLEGMCTAVALDAMPEKAVNKLPVAFVANPQQDSVGVGSRKMTSGLRGFCVLTGDKK